MPAVFQRYARACVRAFSLLNLTMQYPAFSGSSCNATGRSPELLQTIPQLRWGIVLLQKRNMKRNRRTEIASRGRYEESVRRASPKQPSPLQGHRTPYCPWVVWNLGGRARPRNLFARFPPVSRIPQGERFD